MRRCTEGREGKEPEREGFWSAANRVKELEKGEPSLSPGNDEVRKESGKKGGGKGFIRKRGGMRLKTGKLYSS